MSQRVRIRIMQRDGSFPGPNEPAMSWVGMKAIPFPRSRDVHVSIVNDDGTEERLLNVKRVVLQAEGRTEAVTCLLELYNPIVDVEMPIESVQTVDSNDPGEGDFVGNFQRAGF